jgi:hypothetical protein
MKPNNQSSRCQFLVIGTIWQDVDRRLNAADPALYALHLGVEDLIGYRTQYTDVVWVCARKAHSQAWPSLEKLHGTTGEDRAPSHLPSSWHHPSFDTRSCRTAAMRRQTELAHPRYRAAGSTSAKVLQKKIGHVINIASLSATSAFARSERSTANRRAGTVLGAEKFQRSAALVS